MEDITGIRIKKQRKVLGLSVEALAGLLHKAPASVYRYERCDYDAIPAPMIEALSQCLNVSTDYLMRLTDDPTAQTGASVSIPKLRANIKWAKQESMRVQSAEGVQNAYAAKLFKRLRYSKAFDEAFEQLDDEDIHSVLDFMRFLASKHSE